MRILRLAVVALLLPVAVHAQDANGGGRGGGGGRMMAALFNGITLSDVQQKQVDSIRTAYRPQMQSAPRDQRRDLMQKETADMRSVLTPDQQSAFDKNLADMRSRMGGGGSPQ